MRLTLKAMAFAVAVGVMAATAQAADGLLIVQKTTGVGPPQTKQIQIDGTRMRAESSGPTGGKQVVMFDGTKQVLTLVDPDRRTYTELTKAELEAAGGQVASAMAMIQEQLKSMPPEQRAKYEAMMKGRGMSPSVGAQRPKYKKVGTDTVAKWTCDKYEGYVGEEKTSEVCTVEPKALGFAASDFEVSRQMAEFFRKLMPQIADQMFSIGSVEAQGFSGVPVKQTYTVSGRQVTTEITEVTRQAFPASVFQVPEGYEKVAFGVGRGR